MNKLVLKEKKFLSNLEKGDILKKIDNNEFYIIDDIYRERIEKSKFRKVFGMKGFGTSFLVNDIVMKKMFKLEHFSSFGHKGKRFMTYGA